jgi:hypothetical protein
MTRTKTRRSYTDMSRWAMLMIMGMLVLVTGCGGQTAQLTATPAVPSNPTPFPVASTAPTPTVAPTTQPTVEPQAAAATPTTAPTSASNTIGGQTVGGQSAGVDFTPKVRSVWNTAVGLDQMSGTCSKGSMLPVYGLVQITPDGDKLQWKNQEPAPYTFNKQQVNIYQYAGPTAIKDGVVTMTVKFLSDNSLEMNRQFISSADPDCLHTHVYTGTFQWAKP